MAPTAIKEDQGFKGLFPVGTLIHNRYEILSEGKMGGMGMVYKCRDTRHSRLRDVALKLMQPRLLDSKDAIERFQHEASISRDVLHHPNIVRIYHDDQWEDENGVVWHYLLMEWVEGRNLRDLINDRRKINNPFSAEEALRVISQIAAALTYAHDHKEKVIHRDIKPENILVTDEATLSVKLADFGIAKILNLRDLTAVSTPFGVSPYMSPELKSGSPEVDHRTDIYSTGVVLYELFTLDSTIGPFCPSELNRSAPKGMDSIYKKAVAPRVEQRYQSIKALSDDLRREVENEPSHGGTTRGAGPAREKAGEPEGRKGFKVVTCAVIVFLVLAGAAAGYVVYRNWQPDTGRYHTAMVTQREKEAKERQDLEQKRKEAQRDADARKEEEAGKARDAAEKEKRAVEQAKPTLPPVPSAKAKPATPPKAAAAPHRSMNIKKLETPVRITPAPPTSFAEKESKAEMPAPVPWQPKEPEPGPRETQTKQETAVAPAPAPQALNEGRPPVSPRSSADYYYQKGLRSLKHKQFLQAVAEFSRALELNPSHELSYYWRGVAYYRVGSYPGALKDFTNAIRLRPADIYFHWRGVTYFRLNNYYMAADDFTNAIRLRPNNVDYRWRGACYHKLGRHMEADSDFGIAARLGHDYGGTMTGQER